MDCIDAMDPPGRFLNKDKDSGFWYEENKMNALKKTSQALREGAARAKAKAAMMKTRPPQKVRHSRCVTIDLCNESSPERINTVNDNVKKTEKLLSTPAKERFNCRDSPDLACDFSSNIGFDEPACNPFVTELSDMCPYARPTNAEKEQTQSSCVTIDLCNESSPECTNTVNDNVKKTEKLLSTPAKERFNCRDSPDLACDFSSNIGFDEPACNPFVTELSDTYPYARSNIGLDEPAYNPFITELSDMYPYTSLSECISDSNINDNEGSSNELYIRDYELVQKIMDYDRFRVSYKHYHMTRSDFWSK